MLGLHHPGLGLRKGSSCRAVVTGEGLILREICEGGAGVNKGTESGRLGEQEGGPRRREAETELPSRQKGRVG